MTIQHSFRTILADYSRARDKEHLDSWHPLWNLMVQTAADFSGLKLVSSRPGLRVSWSLGQGAWARVPWLALLDRKSSRYTSDGVYVIYLFKQDMSGVYLTMNQGVAKLVKHLGRPSALEQLRQRAVALRSHCKGLEAHGFAMDSSISLSSDLKQGSDYEAATVAHKLYVPADLPDDEALTRDLEHLLKSYDGYLSDLGVRSR